jgi:hypothetical protein
VKRLIFALCILLTPVGSHASNTCPWINAATAFGALGTSPDAAGTNSAITSNSCTFTYQTPNSLHELRVTVEQSSDASRNFASRVTACSSGAHSLAAIGNEAVACAVNQNAEIYGEEVIGRVRDQVFTLTMMINTPKTPGSAGDLQQKAEMLAELISGNLF